VERPVAECVLPDVFGRVRRADALAEPIPVTKRNDDGFTGSDSIADAELIGLPSYNAVAVCDTIGYRFAVQIAV
jgi:hypothetical protein